MEEITEIESNNYDNQTNKHQSAHLGDGLALSGLKRAFSQVSMMVAKATTSSEAAWREELLKYANVNNSFIIF